MSTVWGTPFLFEHSNALVTDLDPLRNAFSSLFWKSLTGLGQVGQVGIRTENSPVLKAVHPLVSAVFSLQYCFLIENPATPQQ